MLRHVSLVLLLLTLLAGVAVLAIGVVDLLEGNGGSSDRVTALSQEPSPGPSPSQTPTPPPVAIEVPSRLVIETIGVDAPVVTFGLDEEGLPQVPLNGIQVAWYDFSAKPGAGSNAVFAGHINWERGPAVFADLSQIQIGDSIKLITSGGALAYTVTDSFLVDPEDPASLKVMEPTETDTVTLISCGGTWIPDPSELFGGQYTNRVIVRAALSSSPQGVPSTIGF